MKNTTKNIKLILGLGLWLNAAEPKRLELTKQIKTIEIKLEELNIRELEHNMQQQGILKKHTQHHPTEDENDNQLQKIHQQRLELTKQLISIKIELKELDIRELEHNMQQQGILKKTQSTYR